MRYIRGVLGFFVFLIGAALVLWAGTMVRDTRVFLATARSVTGTVIDERITSSSRSTSYHPVVRYTAEGVTRTLVSSSGTNPPAHAIGDTVTVNYPPCHPERGQINSFMDLWFLPLIIGGIGAVLILATFGTFVLARRRRAMNLELEHSGQRIEARVTEVAIDRTTSLNGVYPFRIQAQWLDPSVNQVRLFKSDRIWFDPTSYLPEGGHVGVLIDPANPKKYHVDISFVPKLAT
jgi:hypothetical protein